MPDAFAAPVPAGKPLETEVRFFFAVKCCVNEAKKSQEARRETP